MEFNHSSRYVKDLSFGADAKNNIIIGVDKLTKAVKSTLGASGKCVIYEDATGKPVMIRLINSFQNTPSQYLAKCLKVLQR